MRSGLMLTALVVGVAAPMPPARADRPGVKIEKFLHEGEPAPHVPGATIELIASTPQIDAAGNVLVDAFIMGPGVTGANNLVFYYGQPGDPNQPTDPNNLVIVVREGDPAPGFPEGVMIGSMVGAICYVSEPGQIVFSAKLTGPGITPGVNDRALWIGTPGSFTRLLQAGDPAPGLPAGVLLKPSGIMTLGAFISDNGTLLVVSDLTGAGVTSANDQCIWIGTPGNLKLLYREGMPAPGCEPGVTFYGHPQVVFNDAGVAAFRGVVQGPGIDDSNRYGLWIGPPGGLKLIARAGWQVPGMAEGVKYVYGAFQEATLNALGVTANGWGITGPGVTGVNDAVIFGYRAAQDEFVVTLQKGGAAPDADESTIALTTNCNVNSAGELLVGAKLLGPIVDPNLPWACFRGAFESPALHLRDGEPARSLSPGTVFCKTYSVSSSGAMNDNANCATMISLCGRGISAANDSGLWLLSRSDEAWMLLVRSGDTIAGRLVQMTPSAFANSYQKATSGSDGKPQSFNDTGELAARMVFADGTAGVYRFSANPADTGGCAGDIDGDADTDQSDLGLLLSVYGLSEGDIGWIPEADLNRDLTISQADLGVLLADFDCR
jgi:hypothetical protein